MKYVNAGIVLYNPDLELLKKSLDSISIQVQSVILVDNGSKNITASKKLISQYSNSIFIENKSNEGIAKALNQICRKTEEMNIPWVFTLDQDSVCPDKIIECLLHYAGNEKLGIICPAVNYIGWSHNDSKKEKTEYIHACMTSASLTRIEAWKKVGGFQENYFIDFVDNEFCMRLKQASYGILRVNSCAFNHQLGESCEIKMLGFFKIRYSKHAPWRYYYMTRNNIAFIHTYRKFLNVPKEYFKLLYIICTGIVFSREKKNTLHYIRLGYKDASNNKMGKLI